MWRKGFTFMVQTPHLKFGSWNDSHVSTVFFFFFFWRGSNQIFFGYVYVQLSNPSTWLRPLLGVLFCIWGQNEWQDIIADPIHLTIWPPINTYIQKKHIVSPQANWPFLCPHAEKAVSAPRYCVWFGSVFGFQVCYSTFWLFMCCFFFFCPDSLFLYLIKIWKLNFHSIFSNHLIKISSTTTKKIRSSCSK